MTDEPQPSQAFLGVKLPAPLMTALVETAKARGVTQSQLVRRAIATELAYIPPKGKERAKPAPEV